MWYGIMWYQLWGYEVMEMGLWRWDVITASVVYRVIIL